MTQTPRQGGSAGARASMEREGFTSPELSAVLGEYELGKVASVRELAAGDASSPKAVIECARGRLLLKRRGRGLSDPFRVAFQHEVQLALEDKGFPVAPLVGTRGANNSMVQLDGHVYELFRYIEGSPYDGSVAQGEQAGAALARMHRARSRASGSGTPPPPSERPDRAHRPPSAHIVEVAPDADATARKLDALCQRADASLRELGFDRRPTRVIHGDWHPGNTLFAEGRLVGVVDFDNARLAPSPTDLAQGLLQFSLVRGGGEPPDRWTPEPDDERLRALFRGYTRAGGPSSDEAALASLPHLMVESLVREAAQGVAATGRFGPHAAPAFLGAIARKAGWLVEHAEALSALLAGERRP
ncbi:MAG: phosphotransferase [Phycisphaerales bacterium]